MLPLGLHCCVSKPGICFVNVEKPHLFKDRNFFHDGVDTAKI